MNPGLFRLRPVALAVAALVAASGVSTDSSYAKSPVYYQTFDHDGKTTTAQVSDPPYLVSNRAINGSNVAGFGVTGRYIVRFSELPVPRYFADQEAAASRGSSGAFKAKGALGRLHLDSSSATVQNYVQQLSTQQQTHLDKIQTTLGKSPSVVRSFKYALNAVVLENLSSADVLKLVELSKQPGSGIVSVRPDYLHQVNTDIGPGFIGATSIWHGTPAGQDTLFADGFEGATGYMGDGVVIGDIDTGYNSLSPSFAAVDAAGYHIQNPLGSGNFIGDCAGPNAATINLAGGCNDKVIGAYDFLHAHEPNEPVDYVEDSTLDGHGSHTGSTSGGNGRSATIDGYTAPISGVAPHANLVVYRGLYNGSGSDANLASAAEQAIQDGIVDAINYSISGEADPWDGPVSLAFLSATDAGIFVAAAAGNTGTSVPVAVPGTVDNIEPWVISAAASTHTGGPLIDNLVITGPAPAPDPTLFLSFSGTNFSGFLAAVPSSPLLISPAFDSTDTAGTDGCSATVDGGTGYAGGTFTNAVAVISRGTCAFGDKVLSAQNAGAVAVILSDNRVEDPAVQSLTLDDTANSFTPTITIPVFFVSQADGTALKNYLTANTGIAAAIPTNSRRYAVQPDVLASFSLLGPANINVIKPDIQGPGVAILASVANNANKQGPDTVAFFSGTSMATPHTTGTGALLMGLHPDWTPAEVKSAIMMTATEAGLTKPDATTPSDFFDRGSGRIQAYVASKAGLVMNETGLNFSNADPATGGDPATLNLASMQSSSCVTVNGGASTATCGFTRKFRSTQDHSVTWTVSFTGDVNATAASSLVVAAHANSQPLQISVDASTKNDGNFHFGEMVLTPSDSTLPALHLPMAIKVPPPTISATPSPLPINITTGTTNSATLVVKNIGGPTLNVTNTNDTSGSAGISTVLLNQARTGNNGFFSDFWDDQEGGAFLADDFATSVPDTNLSKLSFPGFTLQPGSSLAANVGRKIHFEVYGDAGGIPNGNPQTAAPSYVWNYVATIGTTAGLTVTGDTIGIDLNAAGAPQTHLAAGTYWIVVYFDAATFVDSDSQTSPNGWAWFESNAANGNNAHNIDPTMIFQGATGTWEDNVADGALSGMAMHIEVSASCGAPWLSAAPGTLSIGASLTSNLTVTANSTLFPGGQTSASAFLCLDSNDPAHPVFAVPVTATSTANNPVANVNPASLSLSVNAGDSGTTPLHIGNTGGGTLTWSITEAPAALVPVTKNSVTARPGGASTQAGAFRLTSSGLSAGPRTPAIWAPKGSGVPVMFQADDGTYEDAISLNDGTTQFPALWLNRFAATGALTINEYSIEWPNAATAGGNVVGKSINLVAYYDADADGDPSNAVRLGSDTLITINSTDAFENYPVNFHVPGAGDVYLGVEDAFASGGTSPILYAVAIDEDADPDVGYVSGVTASADPDLNNLANNDLTGSIDSLTGGAIAGAWMVRATATPDGGSTGGCQSPSDVPWLSESPTSGSVGAGLSQDSTITVDASSLAAGSYSAHVCVTTNDTTHALVDVPVSVTVTGTAPVTHTVTPSVGAQSGTIAPNTPQTVNDGATIDFTLTADSGFHIDTVGGTCPAGSLNSGTGIYTTGAIVADCSVVANFAANTAVTHTVTPSVGAQSGTIAPNTPQTVNDGATIDFTLTADSGFHIDTVGGTCPAGSLNSGTGIYTTGAIVADCSVVANFAGDTTTATCTTGSAVEATASAGTAGPTGYATLKGAFDAIDAGTHQGTIAVAICADTTETAPAVLNGSGTGSASYTAITVNPAGGAVRTVSGAITAGSPLVDLVGATNVTIDGLNSGGNALTLSNTTASATASTSTIRFINGASNNTVTRTTILGSSNATAATAGGNVFFSTSTVAGGNSNNTISNNDIGPAGANLPTKGVTGVGTAANPNSGNVIDGNNIHDFFGAAVSSAGVSIQANNNNWTISNNRIYQSAARTFTATAQRYSGILVAASNTLGTFSVTGNVIGFGAPDGTGTTTISGSTNEVRGIAFTNSSTATFSTIQGNTISGINQTSARNSTSTDLASFIGIQSGSTATDAPANIVGNTIGSLDGSSTIVVNAGSTTTNTSPVQGILDFNFAGNVSVTGNNIGSITINQSGGAGTITGFRGILVGSTTGVTHTLSNNTIGGTAPGSITDTIVGAVSMYAIQIGSANIVATGNVIRNITGNSTTANGVVLSGILTTASTGVSTISQNTIYGLTNNSGAASNSIYALYGSFGASSNSIVERNLVHSLSITSTALTSQLVGILPVAGKATYRNNMVRLGVDGNGADITAGYVIYGIFEIAGTNNLYDNSVYVGGSGVASSSNTFAFVSNVTTGTRNYVDNIFWNARSNASGTGANVAISLAAITGATTDYNILYANGSGGDIGVLANTLYPALADWQAATSQEAHSLSTDPLFVAPTGTAATVDLHVQSSSPAIGAGTPIAAVTDDFDGDTRSATAPTIGADERQGGAPPTLALTFAPKTYVASGIAGTLTLTLGNTNASAATLTADLTDNLPTSVAVAATPNANTTCTGTVTANAGDGAFSLGTGAQIPANSTCTVNVDVSSTTAGVYTDTIAAGTLQTDKGSNANPASDNLVVGGTFPAPYCTVSFPEEVDPITSVVFAGISNTSSATINGTSLENFLSVTPGTVGQTGYYTITVKANTAGNFTDYVRVYFDWNHDGVFNEDASERYDVGSITNSTGTDAISATGGVFVPATARSGLTRMRVVHAYGSYTAIAACNSTLPGVYGQAEDYLVLVDPAAPLPPAPPFVSKAFNPAYVSGGAGGISTLTITLTNFNAAALPTTADFTDTFPTGLVIAPTPNASTTCGGGSVSATAGGGSVTLVSGASIPGAGTCTVQVDVTATAGGIYANTIDAGAAQSANGNSPAAASANIQFFSATPTYSTGFEPPFSTTFRPGAAATAGNIYTQQGWYSANISGSGTQSDDSNDWKIVTTHPAGGAQELRAVWTSGNSGSSFALSPDFPSGTTQYSTLSANLAIQTASTGATFDFAPQDDESGDVVTFVRFLRSGTNGATSGKIEVLDPNATSSDGFTDTGFTWTGATSSAPYFNILVVVDRVNATFAVCKDGTMIWSGPAFGTNVNNMAITANKQTGATNNDLDVDDLVIDNTATDGGCTPPVNALRKPVLKNGPTYPAREPAKHAAIRALSARQAQGN